MENGHVIYPDVKRASKENCRDHQEVDSKKKFHEQQVRTTTIGLVLYGYRRKAKNGKLSLFQLMYKVIPKMNGDEPFLISKKLINLLSRKSSVAVILSLTGNQRASSKTNS